MRRFLRYFPLVKQIYYSLYFNLSNLRGKKPFIIYQMGKVGSTGVALALQSMKPRVPVYHVHWMSEQGLDYVASKAGNRTNPLTGKVIPSIHYYEGRYLKRQLQTRFRDRQVYVITLVRDPVARCVSGFFFSGKDDVVYDFGQLQNQYSGNELIAQVRDRFLNAYTFHDVPNTWFDDELKSNLGLDVYDTPFAKDRGWQLYTNERARVLLIRLENLNDVWLTAFDALETGFAAPPLIRANENAANAYGDLYRQFQKQPALPDEYLDRMYETRFAQHFYTPDEIAKFRAKWERKSSEPAESASKAETSLA